DTSVDYALITDDRYVYWTVGQTTAPNPTLFRALKSGGDQPVALGEAGRGLIADADYVYSLPSQTGGASDVVRVAKRDGTRMSARVAGGGNIAALVDRQ